MNAKAPVVVYVAPNGARAGSAGVFITLAANIAAMAPSTNIGAAHPVNMSDRKDSGNVFRELVEAFSKKEDAEKKGKEVKAPEPSSPMEGKIMNDTLAWIRAIAKERGRNQKWAISAVEESISATADEAKKLGIIDFVAKDMDELLAKLNGQEVTVDGKLVTIQSEGLPLIDIEKNFRIKWLGVLAHPNIAYILLMLGFYGLIFEFTNPGIGFPGVAGAIAIILAFFGLQVLPTNYAGVALIVIAIIMLIAEIKVTSYGLLTIGGIVTMFLGSLILFETPFEFMRVSLPIIYAFTGSTLAVALFLIFVVAKSRRRQPATGQEGLIGKPGEVLSWNGGEGKIMIHGEIWNAKASREFAKGDKVVVEIVDGMTLLINRNS